MINFEKWYRRRGVLAVSAAGVLAAGICPGFPMEALAADNSLDYRSKVIGMTGIMEDVNSDRQAFVTRGEFARMLVKASTYRDFLPESSQTAVYADVPAAHGYAPSIRIAAEQNWMTGYLGGNFKPEQPVTLKEAARAVLTLLGYSDEDFSGDTSAGRMALFYSLDLSEELNRQDTEILNRQDCIHLFYNLLKAEMKSGQVYGTVLGCQVNEDGEINPMELADNSLKGPKLVRKSSQLGDAVPFNVQEASIFINGEPSSYESLKNDISADYVVIYYNTASRTIWAYTTDGDAENGRCAVRGTIENIYYSSADVMTPTAIILDDGQEYQLNSSEMQFAFSIYGSLRVGDTVTLICEKSAAADGDAVYRVTDYVED